MRSEIPCPIQPNQINHDCSLRQITATLCAQDLVATSADHDAGDYAGGEGVKGDRFIFI